MSELVQLGKRTYYVTGLFHVGVYVLHEDVHEQSGLSNLNMRREVCLIDSGVDRETAEEIDRLLEEHRFTVRLIINTHYHADHSGGNAYFKGKYDCEILATKINAAMISNYDICPSMIWGACPIPEVMNNYFYAVPTEARELKQDNLPQGISTEELPGHCISMIAVRTDDDILFLGDAVISQETIAKHPLSYIYEIGAYLESLDKLERIRAKLFVPYHAEPVRDILDLAAANRQGVMNNIAMIKDICKEPRTQDEIYGLICKRCSQYVNLYRYAVEGSIVRTYLAYLYKKGEIYVTVENQCIKWKTVV